MSLITLIYIAGLVLACQAVHSEDTSDIATIRSTLTEQAMYIEGLTKAVLEQDRHLKNLDNDNVGLKQIVTDLKADNHALRKLLKANDVKNEAGSRNKRILLNEELFYKPAFTARLSTHLTGIGNQQTIKFDRIESNVGNGYSPLSGVFTAPLNGTYFFFASIVSFYGEYIRTVMVLNGQSIARMYSYGPAYDQGSNAVVVTLQQNDLVWVRHQDTSGDNIYGNNWSTFSGFQL